MANFLKYKKAIKFDYLLYLQLLINFLKINIENKVLINPF